MSITADRASGNTFFGPLSETIQNLEQQFDRIPAERKAILNALTEFIENKIRHHQAVELVFICTHNSRRSHIAQLWAQAAAAYYGIGGVNSYSGGTETTAFNPRAVNAMRETGFKINKTTEEDNPIYIVRFSDALAEVRAFSKKYDSESNPKSGFAAVMTCSHADENCPLIPGAEKRISLSYSDPKDFDGTPQEPSKYLERVKEIGAEILYAFSQIRPL